MPLPLLLSIVGIYCLDYRRLDENQGYFCSAGDDQYLGLGGVFNGAVQLCFWLWVRKRSVRDCLGNLPSYFLFLFPSQIFTLTIK